jgi:hypothetical protein
MEVTKWLKPLVKTVTAGDLVSGRAVTGLNAKHSSKRVMRRPTRPLMWRTLARLGKRVTRAPSRFAGVLARACPQERHTQYRKPFDVVLGSSTGGPSKNDRASVYSQGQR